MSVDLEDRVRNELAGQARSAPVPHHWPELGAPVVGLGVVRRHRPGVGVRVAVVVAAALVVVAAVVVTSRGDRAPATTHTRVAAEPESVPATSGPTVPVAPGTPMGSWDPDGPRLDDDQLLGVVAPSTGPDGATLWGMSPRLAPEQLGIDELPFRAEVTGLSIVQVPLGEVDRARYTGPNGEQIGQIQSYIDNLPASPGRDVHQNVWLVVTTGTFTGEGPDCDDVAVASVGGTPWCSTFAGAFVTAVPTAVEGAEAAQSTGFAVGPIPDMTVDLGAFDGVGHWTPG